LQSALILSRDVFKIEEVSTVAFGAAVEIALAILCFIFRGKDHSDGSHNHDYDKITTDDEHVHT